MNIESDIRNLGKWLNEEQTAPIDRQALARLLAWAQMADKPAAWVYPEFFERIAQAGCWTAYAGDGVGQHPDHVERFPLYRGPRPAQPQKPLTGGDERRHIICLCPDCTKPAQQQPDEFLLRGLLASELKCWHRLTEDEAQNLVDFVQNMPAKPAQQQEPVAWAAREDFRRELGRSVERAREEMKVKSVTMRCKDYDLALPIIDAHFGHVLVGQVSTPPTSKPWAGLTDWEREKLRSEADEADAGYTQLIKATEAKLREKNAPSSKPLTDEQRLAESLRRHGLTLAKTATGYDVLKLGQIVGQITANGVKGDA